MIASHLWFGKRRPVGVAKLEQVRRSLTKFFAPSRLGSLGHHPKTGHFTAE